METKEEILLRLINKKRMELLREYDAFLALKSRASSIEPRIIETSVKCALLEGILEDYKTIVKEQEKKVEDTQVSTANMETREYSKEILAYHKSLLDTIKHKDWYIEIASSGQGNYLGYRCNLYKTADKTNPSWGHISYVEAPYDMKAVRSAYVQAIYFAKEKINAIEQPEF